MDLDLRGRVAIVTGASRGIGLAIVEALIAEGTSVVMNHLGDRTNADAACKRLTMPGVKLESWEADVGDAAAVAQMVDAAVEKFGRLDIAVHNAGITTRQTIVDTPKEDWERVLRTNLHGGYHLATSAAEAMIQAGCSGSLVAISSLHGRVAKAGMGAYCTSKAGIDMMFKQLAVELAPHSIRANVVAPGTIDTGMNPIYHATDPDSVAARRRLMDRVPMDMLGDPRAVARTVAFVSSPVSSYTTGSVVYVDGGYTADGTPR